MTVMDSINRPEPDDGVFLHVLMLCENMTVGRRALNLYERLQQRLSRDFHLSQSLWVFEMLQTSSWNDAARTEAQRADMIVLAMHSDSTLPGAVCSWLESCATRPATQATALVALFDTPGQQQTSAEPATREYLHGLACRGQMDLFIHSVNADDQSAPVLPAAVSPYGVQSDSGNSTTLPLDASQRWGLNE